MDRRNRSQAGGGAGGGSDGGERRAPRVLVASANHRGRELLCRCLTECECVPACTAEEARAALRERACDAAVIDADMPGGAGLTLARDVASQGAGVAVVLVAENPTLEQAIEAMRSGAADMVSTRVPPQEVSARLRQAIGRARAARDRDAKVVRLKRVCRRLNDARHEVTRQVGSLCNDLVEAYQELSDRVAHVSVASEFNSLIRQELDIEGLLRTALEFVLAKVGPTNAAVFLPASSSDWSLGAYVNYDCPKDAADVLLDHLAGVVPARMEGREGILACPTPEHLSELLGDDAHWIAESGAVAFNCRHDNETLAVVILFRDRATPFAATLVPTLRTISELFGRQLARVIRVHHRHVPKEKWGGFGTETGDDDIDLAA